MKKSVRSLALVLMMTSCIALFAGCGNSGTPSPSASPSAAAPNGKLIMATNAEFPPFEFVTTEAKGTVGKFDGIDVVIANEIAKAMGKELEITNITFESILPALASGKADMGVAGMTVKPDRLENADFSDPYWVAVQTILVKKDNTDITNVESLKGKTVGVVTGYTGDLALQEVEGIELKRYQKGVDVVLDLKNGRIDAGVIDSPTAKSFIDKNSDIKGVSDDAFFETEEYAVAVKKGNTELLEEINKVIKELKASGRIEEIAAEVDARMTE